MQYKNGKEVLPASLLTELQKHIQGELIYIPKQSKQRVAWGENSGSRQLIKKRNEEIYQLYMAGSSLEELEQTFCLSIDSIRKIIYQTRDRLKEMEQ
ncbi:CD3324 family protein [Amphibacillus sp. Q70]|uniref:CD3324 family protein n=1 Tax=Amphibacillus sp. Q70 TaxID=3453416 RepID=UPI003F846BB6